MATKAKTDEKYDGFTAEERDAMKERAKELKSTARGGSRTSKAKADTEAEVLAKIADMPEDDRLLAEGVHALVKAAAPELTPKTWYGMPAYAKNGKIVCFFQPSGKFKARYSTLGFNDPANLDDGAMWPTAFAVTALTSETEARITDLVRRAAS
ncbi:iron chaperone [Streptomyces sp. NPDC059690]|uniref:iron chaperone n=1 Tax=Streptomyces sp. NPDC059690 TaxID=3346907 RepID=UPI0036896721